VALARKARLLEGRPSLTGWLHTSTRYAAISAIRGEQRRRAREHETVAMNQPPTSPPDAIWPQLEPLLDEAVGRLSATDREAVLLRYFQGKSHREVAGMLGLSEAAAQKRLSRAVEKIREYFAREGVTVTPALVLAALTTHSRTSAPAGLAASVTGASLAAPAGAGLTGLLPRIYFTAMKIKTVLAAAVAVAAAVLIVAQHRELAQLQAHIDDLTSTVNKPKQHPAAAASLAPGPAVPAADLSEVQSTIAEVIAAMKNGTFSRESRAAFFKYLDGLDNRSLAAALAYADRAAGSQRDLITMYMFDRWNRKDPAAALAYARTIGGVKARQIAVSNCIEAWVKNDPNAAITWVQQLPPGSERDDLIWQSLDYLANTDPATAVKLAGLDAPPQLLPELIWKWMQKDPDAAMAQILTLPEGDARTQSLMLAGVTLNKSDPAAALNWVNSLSNASDRAAALSGILPSLEPTQAMNIVATLPQDGQFLPALGVMHTWVSANPDAPSEWLKTLPPGPAQQTAIRAYVSVLSPSNPAAAAPWADSLTDESTRASVVARVYGDWIRTDPAAAATWLNQTNLSDDAKKQILDPTTPAQ